MGSKVENTFFPMNIPVKSKNGFCHMCSDFYVVSVKIVILSWHFEISFTYSFEKLKTFQKPVFIFNKNTNIQKRKHVLTKVVITRT